MGKNSKRLVLLIGMLASFLGLASPSRADFQITPSITLREEYNDNIFLTHTDKKDDFITSISPSLHIGYTASILTLSLDYGLDIRLYAKNSDENLTSISNAQRAKVDNTFSLYRDIFFIKVSDEYSRVPIDERRQVALDNYIVNMTDSNNLFVSPYVVYPLTGALKTRFGYSYANQWYRDGNSYGNHDGFAGITMDITPNINASITYDYLIHRLIGTPARNLRAFLLDNYDRQTALFAATYAATPKLSLSGSVGPTWFQYKNREDANTSDLLWSAKATYKLTDFISLVAGYNRGFEDSVDSGTYLTEKVEGTISYSGRIPLSVGIHKTRNTYKVIDRKDESSGLTVNSSIPIPIAPKLSGNITGTYDSYTFNPGNEDVKRYSASFFIAREMRITTLTLGYTFNHNDSSIDVNDYTSNIVYVQARFAI